MRGPHRVIAVEDSEETYKELERTLRLLVCPSELLWLKTQVEAEAALGLGVDAPVRESGCLLCVDLALPYAEGEEPDAEGGFHLVKKVRAKYSKQDLPVIVMTAYPDGFKKSVRAYATGADHFLGKPLRLAGVNDPPSEVTIAKLLVEGCERTHRSCPHVGGKGTKTLQRRRGPKAGHEYTTNHTVRLDGTAGFTQRRHVVWLNDEKRELPEASLQILFRLAEHDLDPGDGFLRADKLGLPYAADKVYRLKKELAELGLHDLIESRGGAHRLTCPPSSVTYEHDVMGQAFKAWFKPKALRLADPLPPPSGPAG